MSELFTSRGCLVAALPSVLLLLGCRDTKTSDSLRTKQIAALIDVTNDGAPESTVSVELAVGWKYGDLVKLEKGDVLKATSGGKTATLKSVSNGVYKASLPVAGEGEVVVNFDRAEEQDAPASKGTMPMPFVLHTPSPGDTFSRAEDLTIEWDDVPDARGYLDISGDCVITTTREVTDELGYVTLVAGTVESANPEAPEPCDVEIKVTFERDGFADSALDLDSYFRATQTRSITVRSDP